MSLCPSYYDFTVPVVQDLTLSAFPRSMLYVLWSSFQVTNKLTEQTVKIPTTVHLSFITYYKLNKILQQPFCAYVLVTHQGFASVLNDPKR